MREQRSSEEFFHGKLITLRVETIPQQGGGTSHFEIVEHPDAVAIVALRYDAANGSEVAPQVVLVNQERPAVKKKTWELPAGLVEVNERDNLQLTAARELREETGYLADNWHFLVREYPSPGFSTEPISIYLATHVHPAPDALNTDTPADPTEIAHVRWIPLHEALVLCRNGEIEDGKTLLGLSLVQNLLLNEPSDIGGYFMPCDATNMPFPRSASFRSGDATESDTSSEHHVESHAEYREYAAGRVQLHEFNGLSGDGGSRTRLESLLSVAGSRRIRIACHLSIWRECPYQFTAAGHCLVRGGWVVERDLL